MRAMKVVALFLVTAFGVLSPIRAGVGVGVSLARISMDEPLVGGGNYRLPSVGVVNTGTEPADYEVGVSYRSGQKELRLPAEWVSFNPVRFHLEPGAVQHVAITLEVPIKGRPGDYFSFVEAHLASKGKGVPISVAAATKLYFTVRPSNILVAIRTKVANFLGATAPASYICLGLIVFIGATLIFKKFFRIRFTFERK